MGLPQLPFLEEQRLSYWDKTWACGNCYFCRDGRCTNMNTLRTSTNDSVKKSDIACSAWEPTGSRIKPSKKSSEKPMVKTGDMGKRRLIL